MSARSGFGPVYEDDDPGIMSEAETEATGGSYRRGGAGKVFGNGRLTTAGPGFQGGSMNTRNGLGKSLGMWSSTLYIV